MRRSQGLLLLLVSSTSFLFGPANAQDEGIYFPNQRSRRNFRTVSQVSSPPVSPYLNLTRTDVPASLNYFTLVRPQVEQDYMRAQLSGAGRPARQIQNTVPVTRRPGQTGHVARFMDYSNFYFRKPGQ